MLRRWIAGAVAAACLSRGPAATAAPAAPRGVVGQVEVEHRSLTVGSLIPVKWWVEVAREDRIEWPRQLPPGIIEVRKIFPPERQDVGHGRVRESVRAVLSTFEVGALAVPGPRVAVSGRDSLLFQLPPAGLLVRSVLGPNSKSADIRDIKGPALWKRPLPPWVRWAALAVAGLGLLVLGVWLIFRLIRARREAEARIPYPVRALRDLALLRKSDLLLSGRQKEFHIRLTDILRRYLGEHGGFDALDLTTSELLLRAAERVPGELDPLRRVLEGSDLVKFAKYAPPTPLSEEFLEQAVKLVERTRPLEEAAA